MSRGQSTLKHRLIKQFGFKCNYCGESPSHRALLTVDHIIPRFMGGSNERDNLQLLCEGCHNRKSHLEACSIKDFERFNLPYLVVS